VPNIVDCARQTKAELPQALRMRDAGFSILEMQKANAEAALAGKVVGGVGGGVFARVWRARAGNLRTPAGKVESPATAEPPPPPVNKPATQPAPPVATHVPPPPASASSIWGQGSTIQGRGAEAVLAPVLPGKKFYGSFPNFDRAVYGPGGPKAPALEIGQLKSIDTCAPSYQGRKLYNRIMTTAGEVAGPGESMWSGSGSEVTIGPNTRRVVDLALPETPLTAAQNSMVEQATTDSATLNPGVEIRVHRVP
jgi:hypothetical protein